MVGSVIISVNHKIFGMQKKSETTDVSGINGSLIGSSETGCYKWKRTSSKPKAWKLLLVKIHRILEEPPDNKNYGIGKIMTAFQQKGEKMSRWTVIRAMRKGNLLPKNHRNPDGLTKADKKAQRPENVLRMAVDAVRYAAAKCPDVEYSPEDATGTVFSKPVTIIRLSARRY